MNSLQSMLDPAGPQASRIAALWWILFAIAALVTIAVIIATLVAARKGLARRRDALGDEVTLQQPPERHRRATTMIAVLTAATALVLFAFLVLSIRTGRAIATPATEPALEIQVTGRQWWWAVDYLDPLPDRRLTTANELVIPVGRPVRIKLVSADVIHSLWIPNLAGKRDLVPGIPSFTWIQADSAGAWRAVCAEFCGYQHAKMALWVVALPESSYARWYDAQLQPATTPADSLSARGHDLFMTGPCAMCHSIRGTSAGSRVGPDLTHLASRRSLAAGSLPNDSTHLRQWVTDPQRIKPGARMPPIAISDPDLRAILHYLGTLR
jgi:cytochrome c oxidase subunit 2